MMDLRIHLVVRLHARVDILLVSLPGISGAVAQVRRTLRKEDEE